MTTKDKQVATQQPTGGAVVPSYIKRGSNRGSETVKTDDLVIPRLEIVQALSKCLKENTPEYIEGAKQGMLYNSVTRQLYGDHVIAVPVFFRKEYLVWMDRKLGGGYNGAFSTPEEAKAHIKALNKQGLEVIDTAQELVLVMNPSAPGGVEEMIMSMARSRLKVDRKWNSIIRMTGDDRFACQYKVQTVEDKNSANQDYWNLAITPAGHPTEAVYTHAEKLYEQVASGAVKFSVSMTDDEEAVGDPAPGAAGAKPF